MLSHVAETAPNGDAVTDDEPRHGVKGNRVCAVSTIVVDSNGVHKMQVVKDRTEY